MISRDRHQHRIRHITATGTALAAALGPLLVGVLLARLVGADPTTPVNALIAGGGQRARISREQIRGCGDRVLRRTAGAGARTTRSPRSAGTRPTVPSRRCGADRGFSGRSGSA
ncbi:hypothetical protein [Streptomyces sp. NBC_01216]|uniref:hypothetical protein n=1 Tax=unclassified Streptomyces TaxID=2593676 RepID=UPI002E0ECB85|nr:hypothetical protein OG393_31395 [Streptomyces sp. NBC_01216]